MTPLRDQVASLATIDRSSDFRAGIIAAVAAIDQYEHERRAQSAAVIAQFKAEGRKTGGDVPYGYQLDHDGTTLRESSSEQRVIALVKKLRAEGLSLRDVARRLEEERMYPRPVKKQKRTRFHAAQIRRIAGEDDEGSEDV